MTETDGAGGKRIRGVLSGGSLRPSDGRLVGEKKELLWRL